MKKNDKVYWVNGWPNNGLGYFKFKIPFMEIFIVKDRSGKIIICRRVVHLEKAIKAKENIINYENEHPAYNSLRIQDLIETNIGEVYEMKKFLNS